ncbi:MAG: hypothetical protein JO232_11600 [Verrucomicrobia bacterium]|nr:hypothetical protein [Verrucomicrobiota bacterium]
MRFGVFSEVGMVKGNMAPGPKTIHKLLRLILWITIGALFIAGGCAACALLWKETDTTKAVLLAVAALIGAAGCAQAFALLIERVAAIATEGRLAPTVEEAADLVWASANAAYPASRHGPAAPPTSAVLEQIRENAMRSILNSETKGRSQ